MAEKDSGEFTLIPKNQYVAELEEQVAYYLRTSESLPVSNTIFKKVEFPEFKSPSERKAFERNEIKKIIEGDGVMCGKMYFWFNYCFLKNIKGGKISPQYRVCDDRWFATVERATKSEEWGIVCVKRRRGGFSWKEAADTLHDCLTKPYSHIGLNSKTERDSFHLFQKILFIYDNLPGFLKAKIGRKIGMHMEFFRVKKLDDGTKKVIGLQSEITVVPPTDTAYEGLMLSKWVCDEAGKIPNLPQLWSFTEDCLMQEYRRVGVPILFGTSGDIATTGGGLMHMWDKADSYRLIKFFFAGWMGIAVDEYGNDKKEEVIRWIIYERQKRAAIDPKTYNDFLQRYPLTIEEAFSQASSGLGNTLKINAQLAKCRGSKPIYKEGVMRMDINSMTPTFYPQKFGHLLIVEDPNPNETYVLSCDPADHDEADSGASNLSLHVFAVSDGVKPTRVVAEMCYRPEQVKSFYEQAYFVAAYYNNSKILIENNRFGMIQYFKENSLHQYLALRPTSVNFLFRKRSYEIGVRMTTELKQFMLNGISEYLDDNIEWIPFIALLQEFLDFGKRNTDRVMSFGIGLIYARDIAGIRKTTRIIKKSYNPNIPDISYKMINGRMTRVSNRNQTTYKEIVNE
jgi:hypothetical protein